MDAWLNRKAESHPFVAQEFLPFTQPVGLVITHIFFGLREGS
jgi:hypothetical protein